MSKTTRCIVSLIALAISLGVGCQDDAGTVDDAVIIRSRLPVPMQAHASKKQMSYVFLAHPDDEYESWGAINGSTNNYTVFVLMTKGAHTGHCPSPAQWMGSTLLPEYSYTQGTERDSPECARRRLASWHTFLDEMADLDERVNGRKTLPKFTMGAQHAIYFDDRQAEQLGPVRLYANEYGARLVFDVQDGQLRNQHIALAMEEIQRLKADGALPNTLPDYQSLAGSYWWDGASHEARRRADLNGDLDPGNDDRDIPPSSCEIYVHPDHRAVQIGVYINDLGTTVRRGRTCSEDADANYIRVIPDEVHEAVRGGGPLIKGDGTVARETFGDGIFQKHYGWLHAGGWGFSVGRRDESSYNTQTQFFWQRARESVVVGRPCSEPSSPQAIATDPAIKQISYVYIAHPDDEYGSWSLIGEREDTYPVFVLMTRGGHTGHCINPGGSYTDHLGNPVPDHYTPRILEEHLAAGEDVHLPAPLEARDQPECKQARVDSWHAFLNAMGEHDQTLGTLSEAHHVLQNHTTCDQAKVDVWVGPKSARVVFDYPDNGLYRADVLDANDFVRSLRNRGVLPQLPEAEVLGVSLFNRVPELTHPETGETVRVRVYEHPDHIAVNGTVDREDFGVGLQRTRTMLNGSVHPGDTRGNPRIHYAEVSRGVHEFVGGWHDGIATRPPSVSNSETLNKDPAYLEQVYYPGPFFRYYGWLRAGGDWLITEDDERYTFFTRQQAFLERDWPQ